jgi:hypothetical protein
LLVKKSRGLEAVRGDSGSVEGEIGSGWGRDGFKVEAVKGIDGGGGGVIAVGSGKDDSGDIEGFMGKGAG